MSLDLDRITHPLRLAAGSHQAGSGKGCAMNVISYINGDTKITDFPDCSARPLAVLVQHLNDRLAGGDGFLSPENSVLVLDLGWQTVGTAGMPRNIMQRWLSELLIDPEYGVVKHAHSEAAAVAIRRVAALCMRAADCERVAESEWREAREAADAAADAAAYTAAYAAYAAADAAAAAYAAADAYADAAAYTAAYTAAAAAAYAYAAAAAYARINFTAWAIRRWRELAGLDNTAADADAINLALAQMTETGPTRRIDIPFPKEFPKHAPEPVREPSPQPEPERVPA